MKLVIIGLGTAGFAAILAAKKTNPSTEIIVIDPKDFDLLHSCGLPYGLDDEIELEKLKHDLGLEAMGVKKIKGKATKIDTKAKIVVVDNKEKINYDKLLISPGASAFVPPIEGADLEHVHIVHTINSTKKLYEALKNVKTAVVTGAGAIGMEVAAALRKRNIDVAIVEARSRILANSLDLDIADALKQKLEEKGIKFYMNFKVERITKKYVVLEGKKELRADIVVIAAGTKPNIDFLKDSGIAIDKGIIVNDKMETNIPEVYAAGDVVQVKSLINGRPYIAWLATPAYKQGTIAGINAAGGSARYKGALATFVSVIADNEVAATGFTEEYAKSQGIETIFGKVKGTDAASWFPNAKESIVKVIFDKKTHKLIGCQALGSGASKRVDIAATAIAAGMTLEQMQDLELAYCPPVSDVYDVLVAAVEQAARKLMR